MSILQKHTKRVSELIISQAGLCAIETYLVSKISLIGKIAIALIHPEYRLLRSGWKTFFLFFFIQLAVIAALEIARRKTQRAILAYTAGTLILIGLCGLGATYVDFLHTYSHRLLKERFHMGFYVFWLGWIGSCIVFLVDKKRPPVSSQGSVDAPLGVESSRAQEAEDGSVVG